MTLIRPSTKSLPLTMIFIGLAILVLGLSIWLIISYNKLVDLKHALGDMQTKLRNAQLAAADLKEKSFIAWDMGSINQMASEMGLVSENKPAYFQASVVSLAKQGN